MASPFGKSNGSVNVDDGQGSSINIEIAEPANLKAEGLSFSTWGAAFLLSNLIHKLKLSHTLRNSRDGPHRHDQFDILEIGAGTGLSGIAAAALWRSNAVLTDLPPILPGLQANIDLNQRLLQSRSASVSCGSLDWNEPSTIRIGPNQIVQPGGQGDGGYSKPSIILAADTFYDPSHAPLVVNTIKTWLAPGTGSTAIVCYPLRFAYIDCIREFWELMEADGLGCVQEGRDMGKEEWNEVSGTEFEWCIWKWKA